MRLRVMRIAFEMGNGRVFGRVAHWKWWTYFLRVMKVTQGRSMIRSGWKSEVWTSRIE